MAGVPLMKRMLILCYNLVGSWGPTPFEQHVQSPGRSKTNVRPVLE
jgi:hypothetical protein